MKAFTDFKSVEPSTDLSRISLNWREEDLPERERTKHVHRLHPYLGKFVPQLVEIFLRKFRPAVVCDPFAGSGTTLVEAAALGIDSIGCDISAFNCLVCKVKTGKYNLVRLESEIKSIVSATEDFVRHSLFSKKHNGFETDSEYLKRWYAEDALNELLCYKSLISKYHYKDVLRVILSRSARSSRLTTHFDLDFPRRPQTEPYYCYKHSRTCQPTTDALQFLRRYSLDTLERIREFSQIRTNANAMIIQGDARSVRIPQMDCVITSPPYVGLIDYHEQHRYAYELLGLRPKEKFEIGAAMNGSSKKAIEAYRAGIKKVFLNVRKSLQNGGVVVIVVNDRHKIYKDLAGELGFRVEQVLERHVNRRTGRRSSDFYEEVLIWRKND